MKSFIDALPAEQKQIPYNLVSQSRLSLSSSQRTFCVQLNVMDANVRTELVTNSKEPIVSIY